MHDEEVFGEVMESDFDGSLRAQRADKEPETTVVGSEQFTSNPARQPIGMDKLVYEMVAEEEDDEIENAFETTALKATALRAKLDMRIDETILKLQSLKNLRRHIEKAYKFANKFISSQATNDEGKRFVLADLQKSVDQVEETLNYSDVHSADNAAVQQVEPLSSSQRNS